jgi:hypothetical protein
MSGTATSLAAAAAGAAGAAAGFFFSLGSRCGLSRPFRFKDHQQFAGFGFITDGNFDLFNHTRLRGRDFHRSFVAFYGDQRLFSFNFVAHFDQDLGDFHFVCPDVRYVDFDSHYSSVPLTPDAG